MCYGSRSRSYNPSLSQAGTSLYCNASVGAGEIRANGPPWGFYTHALPGGSALGFPLVLMAGLPEERVPTVLTAVKEGAYLNKHLTQTLAVKVWMHSC